MKVMTAPLVSCSGDSGLHAGIVRRAGRMLPEFPVSPPALLPHGGEGSFVSRLRDFHINGARSGKACAAARAGSPGLRRLRRALASAAVADRRAAAQRSPWPVVAGCRGSPDTRRNRVARRNASSGLLSTPSATTRKPRLCAMAMIAVTIAALSLSRVDVGDQGAIDLHLIDREALEVAQRRIAGAEVIDGQRYTTTLDLVERC
jgi:hypothetical protein